MQQKKNKENWALLLGWPLCVWTARSQPKLNGLELVWPTKGNFFKKMHPANMNPFMKKMYPPNLCIRNLIIEISKEYS